MKKLLLTIIVLFVTLLTMAQSPNLMNFQGVARNAVGNVLPNQLIGVRLSILNTSATGPVVYQECRNVFTNAFGLFVVVMGSAGTICQTGTIAGVNWSGINPVGAGPKFLQVEIDPAAGSNYVSVGSTQMVSVPYALNAGGAAPIGPAGGDLTGTYPNPQILIPLIKSQSVTTGPMISMTNTAATGPNGAYFGSSASTDVNTAAIIGALTATAGGVGAAGVRGNNASTNANGSGVMGTHAGSGIGVYGTSPSGSGVRGESGGAGVGVYGTSASGAGVYGTSASNSAGFFENTTAANTTSTLVGTTNGSGNAVNGINSGTGRGGLFQVTNAASTASALEAQTNGVGASWALRATSTGTNGAGLFIQSNATNTANNVQSNQAGLGTAGFFQNTNTANNADAILATTVTIGSASAVHGQAGSSGLGIFNKKGVWGDSDTGAGVFGTSSSGGGVSGYTTTGVGVAAFAFTTGTALAATSLQGVSASITSPAGNAANTLNVATAGTGAAASVDNTNAANVSNVIQATNANIANGPTSATTGGGATIFARKGAGLTSFITNPTAVYASVADPAAGQGIASLGITNNGMGVAGFSLNNGTGVLGQASAAGGIGVSAVNTSTGYALVTSGRVQIQGQGAGVNKVLSSDAVGNATWNTLAAIGGVSGTGTLNYVAKWTPNGTTLGNSQIYDDGTNVGVGTGSPNGKLDVANGSNTIRGMQVINSSTTNPSSTIFAQNNSIGGTDPVESAAVTGLFSPILVATPVITGPSAIKGIASPNATVGALGGIGVQGASGNGYGVAGVSNNGTGVYAYGIGGTSYALQTNGRVQIQGQGAGAGNLFSSDAVGNGTWNTPASLNLVSGNGTVNYMTKWNPNGNTISNAQMFDDGTNVGLGTITATNKLEVIQGATSAAVYASKTSATGTTGAVVGTSASQDANAIGVQGVISSTSPGGFSAAVRGTNNGTGSLGIGVMGTQAGSGWGVYGTTPSGIGVRGLSTSGIGVYGESTTGNSIMGVQPATGNQAAGYFQNLNTGNGSATLFSTTNGQGAAVMGMNTGIGEGGYFFIANAANAANAVVASTNGIGNAVNASTTGTGRAGLFSISNAANNSNSIEVTTNGTGRAGLIQITNAASVTDALNVLTAGTGRAILGRRGAGSGIGLGLTEAIRGDNTDGPGVAGTSASYVGVYGTSGIDHGVWGIGQVAGKAGVEGRNDVVGGFGVEGVSLGGGIGVRGSSQTGSAASFAITNAANSSNLMSIANAGQGHGIDLTMTNTSSVGSGINITTPGPNRGIFVTNSGTNINSHGVEAIVTGSTVQGALVGRHQAGGEAVVGISNTVAGIGAVVGRQDGQGYGVRGFLGNAASTGVAVIGQSGISGNTGVAGRFENVNALNPSDALQAATNGTGWTATFNNANISSASKGIRIVTTAGQGGNALTVANGTVALSYQHPYASGTVVDDAILVVTTAGNVTVPTGPPLVDGANVWVVNNSGAVITITNTTVGALNVNPGRGQHLIFVSTVSGANWIPAQ